MNNDGVIKDILEAVNSNGSFFITSHAGPDGDSVGSQLALASFLKRLGKSVCVANVDKVPLVYRFLAGWEEIRVTSNVEDDFDAAFFLDCSCLSRTENIIDVSKHVKILVDIDHHMDNEFFGKINYIEKNASSASELVYNIIMGSSLELNKDEAQCLYVGMLTDTGKFQETNTSAESHLIAADLIKRGVSVPGVTDRVYRSLGFNQVKLLGKVLETLEVTADKRVASLVVNQEMFKATGTNRENTEGLVDYARNLKGVEVGILFREIQGSGQYKVSLRSKNRTDVNRIAKTFNGGGHRNAAGCTVKGSIAEVKEKVLKTAGAALDG